MNSKILGVFFTKGISVERWHKMDLLDREKLLYEEFIKRNIFQKIFWFTYGSDDKKYEQHLAKGIVIVPKPKIFNLKYGSLVYSFLLPFIKHIYIRQCAVIKTNQMTGSWSAVLCKIIYHKKLLIRTGFTMTRFLKEKKVAHFVYRAVEKLAYRFADQSIVSSEHDKKYLVKHYRAQSEIKVIRNYIDMKTFKPLNIEKRKDLVFVGRLTQQKNLFGLIDALRGLRYSLDIYGSGVLAQRLSDYAINSGSKISFFGNVPNPELPSILNQYKLYVLPSFYEGMPKTLIEAMACGLPCLGTDVEGINELIQHKKNGFLVKTDPASIRAGIISLMENESLRRIIGQQARLSVKDRFSLENAVMQEQAIYSQLIC